MSTEITAPITITQVSITSTVQVSQVEVTAPVGVAGIETLINVDGGTPTSVYGGVPLIDGGNP